jgi:hypothetical protein
MSEVFIIKGMTVYRFTTCSRSISDITALHEGAVEDTMEVGSFVGELVAFEAFSFVPSAKTAEVLGSYRAVFIEGDYYPA